MDIEVDMSEETIFICSPRGQNRKFHQERSMRPERSEGPNTRMYDSSFLDSSKDLGKKKISSVLVPLPICQLLIELVIFSRIGNYNVRFSKMFLFFEVVDCSNKVSSVLLCIL